MAAAAVTALGGVAAAGAQAATSGTKILAGSVVSATARQHPVGAVATSAKVDFELVLALRNAAAAQALIRSVSSPGSPGYRHYLTAAQWEARFSPGAGQVSAARSWLRSQGFTVGAVAKDRITISASGTAGQVEKAFGTGLENYRVGGHTVRMTTRAMSVPAALGASVVGAMGVNQSIATPAVSAATAASASAAAATAGAAATASKTATAGKFPPPPAAFLTAKPCGAYYDQKVTKVTPPFGHGYPASVPYEVCGYHPGQLRSAYDVDSGTGKGVTVAIIDAYGSATVAQDATHYFALNDAGNPFASAHFAQLDATPFNGLGACAPSSWQVEQAIDIDAVHGMAPNAHVLYVGAKNCFNGLFDAEQKVIDNRLADVVTNSWGDDAGDLLDDVATKTAYNDLFMLAGTTGMSVMFSSGDNGDNFNLFGFSSSDFPTESPYVTSVGGTSLQVGSDGQQLGAVGWATGRAWKCTANAVNALPGCTSSAVGSWLPASYDGGGGGFTSYTIKQPWYQKPVVPSALALRNQALTGSTPMRVNPDVSLEADPSTGLLIGLHEIFPNGKDAYNQPRYGGTSLASPLLAGVIADANSLAKAGGGADVGFVNPAMYKLSATSGVISDVLPGGLQGQIRVDHAFTYLGPTAKGFLTSFRELTYEGVITYCDATGNCASRPNTLSTAKGYDSMTGLGSIGHNFIGDLAGS